MISSHQIYRTARDHLARRQDYADAVATFEWPTFEGPFNWAHDWFDVIATDNDRTALHIVEEDTSRPAAADRTPGSFGPALGDVALDSVPLPCGDRRAGLGRLRQGVPGAGRGARD